MEYLTTILTELSAAPDWNKLTTIQKDLPAPYFEFWHTEFPRFFRRVNALVKDRLGAVDPRLSEDLIRRVGGEKLEQYLKACKKSYLDIVAGEIMACRSDLELLHILFRHRQFMFTLHNHLRLYAMENELVIARLARVVKPKDLFTAALRLCQGEKIFARGLVDEYDRLVQLAQKLHRTNQTWDQWPRTIEQVPRFVHRVVYFLGRIRRASNIFAPVFLRYAPRLISYRDHPLPWTDKRMRRAIDEAIEAFLAVVEVAVQRGWSAERIENQNDFGTLWMLFGNILSDLEKMTDEDCRYDLFPTAIALERDGRRIGLQLSRTTSASHKEEPRMTENVSPKP